MDGSKSRWSIDDEKAPSPVSHEEQDKKSVVIPEVLVKETVVPKYASPVCYAAEFDDLVEGD